MNGENAMLMVLGSAQDAGIPQANCYCDHCQKLRESGLRRFAASLGIMVPERQQWYLIDATPDLPYQLDLVHRKYPEVGLMDGVLITHGHIGHYTGLMFLGREVISASKVPVWAGRRMQKVLSQHQPWRQLVELENITLHDLRHGQPVMLGQNISVVPLAVPHRNEYSETFGFIINGPKRKALYISDIDRWEQCEWDICQIAGEADYCLVDGTFFSYDELSNLRERNFSEVPHPPVVQTARMLQGAADRGAKVIITHINHTNPLVNPESGESQYVKSMGLTVAREGMELTL